jgi:hypothetical protein
MLTVRPEKESLEYEQPSRQFATRGQFRWLLILLILNLAITIQTAYRPAFSSTLKAQWTQYREAARPLHHERKNRRCMSVNPRSFYTPSGIFPHRTPS